jgi:hypothetical protein
MSFFKQVEGEAAVLVENGIYKQVDLYTRDGFLYAKISGGFVRLYADGSITKSKLRLETMSWEGALHKDKLGRLGTKVIANAKALPEPDAMKLLGKGEPD